MPKPFFASPVDLLKDAETMVIKGTHGSLHEAELYCLIAIGQLLCLYLDDKRINVGFYSDVNNSEET